MLRKHQKWYLPFFIAGLVLFQGACGTAAKQEQAIPLRTGEEKHWGYTGEVGPAYWHTLDAAYSLAKDGKAQSPVNIATGDLAETDTLSKPVFHYAGIPFKMENNGHTIELVPSDQSNYITIDTVDYVLQQVHFHAPSEHQINGESFAMEAHLVHKDSQGAIAVVGILIAPGGEHEVLKEAFAKLPKEITHEEDLVALDQPIDLSALFPGNTAWYRYDGSLTTPPCTEGVKWSVSDQVMEMSQAQIDAFTAIYSGNNRPVQNLYERKISIIK
jgi:carbonic anhydrase